MWHCGGFFPFGFFFILLFGFLIFKFFIFRGWRGTHRRFDAEALLKRRLIYGEIDEAEYERLREILNR